MAGRDNSVPGRSSFFGESATMRQARLAAGYEDMPGVEEQVQEEPYEPPTSLAEALDLQQELADKQLDIQTQLGNKNLTVDGQRASYPEWYANRRRLLHELQQTVKRIRKVKMWIRTARVNGDHEQTALTAASRETRVREEVALMGLNPNDPNHLLTKAVEVIRGLIVDAGVGFDGDAGKLIDAIQLYLKDPTWKGPR